MDILPILNKSLVLILLFNYFFLVYTFSLSSIELIYKKKFF